MNVLRYPVLLALRFVAWAARPWTLALFLLAALAALIYGIVQLAA